MAASVRVAVCTNRPAAAVAGSLAALREQVPEGDLALVTSGLAGPELEAHRRAFDGPVVVEPRPGLSRARNAALAWAGDDEAVIAFVDDDAVVEAGWHSALTRRWDEAPPEVACIGGPIRPRFAGSPPPWYSDGIAHVLTLLDRGGAVRDLDPEQEAVYGANISFRAGPLRRAGGFDPDLGHAGGRVWFGEEDEAQRALARLGFGTRYVPDAAVWHVIPPNRLRRRAFLRRRFAYGRVLGARAGRPRALAARRALVTGLGAAAAAATGQQALAMTRAVRAAENVGVLTARSGGARPA
ncbi:MAG: glucosyl-dolichyl phosphate glucuronosyltransferase [Thermoleophilaceae bacterium]|nr:glucosyl-dolichyl phosphate glucuronosyltransferase [Thermoleophilaceae bacterium]